MKNSLLIILLFFIDLVSAQTLVFNSINSKNVLDLFNYSAPQFPESTSNSRTQVIQKGNNNDALVIDKSKKSDLLIRQTGDFNTTLMNNSNPKLENNQKVNIEGFNNYIDITGNNSNSKNMQINLKTDDKMIFIRHY